MNLLQAGILGPWHSRPDLILLLKSSDQTANRLRHRPTHQHTGSPRLPDPSHFLTEPCPPGGSQDLAPHISGQTRAPPCEEACTKPLHQPHPPQGADTRSRKTDLVACGSECANAGQNYLHQLVPGPWVTRGVYCWDSRTFQFSSVAHKGQFSKVEKHNSPTTYK